MADFYNTEQVADILGISPRTVLRRIKDGKLIGEKQNGQWMLPENQFQKPAKDDKEGPDPADSGKKLDNEYIEALKDTIERQDRELDRKNNHIEQLHSRLKEQAEDHRREKDQLYSRLEEQNRLLQNSQLMLAAGDKNMQEYRREGESKQKDPDRRWWDRFAFWRK